MFCPSRLRPNQFARGFEQSGLLLPVFSSTEERSGNGRGIVRGVPPAGHEQAVIAHQAGTRRLESPVVAEDVDPVVFHAIIRLVNISPT